MSQEVSRIWVETSTDSLHGGEGWGLGTCLWCPTTDRKGHHNNSYDLVSRVKKGDFVLHMHGKKDQAAFVGTSIATSDAYRLNEKPPRPGQWEWSNEFWRVDLSYTPLAQNIPVMASLHSDEEKYLDYYETRKNNGNGRIELFYNVSTKSETPHFGRNEKYFSWLDAATAKALTEYTFSNSSGSQSESKKESEPDTAYTTDQHPAEAFERIGQKTLRDATLENYNYQCCFPGCRINDLSFLVASHIQRWADNEETRGDLNNILCLCVLHDKAFEYGYFGLDDTLRVVLSEEQSKQNFINAYLKTSLGKTIDKAITPPSSANVAAHRLRKNL